MHFTSSLAILSAISFTAAIPLAEQEQHGGLQNSIKHEQKSLNEVCAALNPNQTEGVDLHNMTKLQIKCSKYLLSQAHSNDSTPHDSKKRAIQYPQDLKFGTMTMCTLPRFAGTCLQDPNVQDGVCRKVKLDAQTMAPGINMNCQLRFDNDKCQGKGVGPFFFPGMQDWKTSVWGAAVSGRKSPRSYACVKK